MKTINFSVTADCDNQEWARSDSAGGVKIILPKKGCEYLVALQFFGKDPGEITGFALYEAPADGSLRPVGSCGTICR